jgi:methylated-DNA-[protein]-cysteine S-methyltransferase
MTIKASRVYTLLRRVPRGRVTTYKAVADRLHTKAYHAIGQILKRNPDAPYIPCHRVVASNGMIGGFMGQTSGKAIQKKRELLEHEGVKLKGNKIQNFEAILYQWN